MAKMYRYSLSIVAILVLVVLIVIFISDSYKGKNLPVLKDKELSIEVMLDLVSKRMESGNFKIS